MVVWVLQARFLEVYLHVYTGMRRRQFDASVESFEAAVHAILETNQHRYELMGEVFDLLEAPLPPLPPLFLYTFSHTFYFLFFLSL